MINLHIVNGYFLIKYKRFYIEYKRLMTGKAVPYTSFSQAIASAWPVEATPEEVKLVKSSKKIHTSFNVNIKLKKEKGKASGIVAVTVALLRAMARDLPEFKEAYERDLEKLKKESTDAGVKASPAALSGKYFNNLQPNGQKA